MESKGITDLGMLPSAERKQARNSTGVIADKSHRFTQQKTAETTTKQAAKPETLATAVTKLNDYVQSVDRSLAFSVDEDSGQTIVKVFNRETEELIRQIPAEHTLKLAAAIEQQSRQGILFKAKA